MPDGKPSQDALSQLTIRTYQSQDRQTVSRLFREGRLVGQIPPTDTGADIERIRENYLTDEPANHFWVAELHGRVLGMIGVLKRREHTAEVRRLRVDKPWQDTPIGAKLMETALAHCRRHGFLKVVLDTGFDTDVVMGLFDRFGFQHTRTKNRAGKEVLEFYLDLYRPHKPEQPHGHD